ncbi:TonB-dependent receptor plug domain-containing protein [Dyella tabacisoli]|uniref:TonB-dependent receptor n=1 Tax=Dyella tabacisoli TaxID=2282381 RepID=A0A369UNZ6_9GAMM|nr:TonB-dependent receptor [Dyella tabacisoli]RDD82474.1 TonB-dependent receptor [Dyella tabacisoli]
MKQKTLLATAIGAALMLPIWAASAQDATQTNAPAEQAKAKSLETVTVTGSRIRSVDLETAQPVFSLSRQEIQKQGYTSTGDILSHITASGSPSYSKSAVLTSNTYAGSSTVELRGLGAARTLVLVDGRRWGTNADGFTDLDTIPSSIIERIDVLKDGASAIYGSDAIAGVINIITRSDFKGAEANAYYGQYGKGDGAHQQYDFSWGNKIGKLSYVLSGTYAKDDPVWARDRDFSATPNGPFRPNSGLSPYGPGGQISNGPGGKYKLNDGADPTNFANYHPYNAATDNYNADEQMMLISGAKRKSLFGKATYAITDNVNFRADAAYTERTANIQTAGYPIGTGNTGLQLDKDSYYNPLGSQQGYAKPQNVSFLRRAVEQPRENKNTLKTYRVGAGFDGVFQLGERNFNWDASAFFNKNKGEVFGVGNYNLLNLAQGLGPSFKDTDGTIKCGRPGAVITGCTPVNMLSGAGGLTPAMLNYIGRPTDATYGTQTTGFAANIGGDVVQLPAGMMQFAAGVEYRRESGYFHPDSFSQAGNSTNPSSTPSSGKYNTKEAYAELNIPVLADLPFAKLLSVDLASRYSKYSTFGNTTNSKFGLQWKPIDDLLVRGSISEGFRSPTINNLFGGTNQTFDVYTDPCDSKFGAVANGNANAVAACQAAGLKPNFRQTDASGTPTSSATASSSTPFLSGSNPKLQPETSLSKTLGLVYSPSYVDGLNVSLDWYNIRIKNEISSITSNDVLEDCYLRNLQASCGKFSRNAQGQVVNLTHTLANRGSLETEGYDFNLVYRLPKFSFGQFKVSLDTNYVSKNNETLGSGVIKYDVGQYSTWRIRSNANLDWSYGDFGATWGVRYYSGLKENCTINFAGGPECDLPNYVSPGVGITPKRQVGGIAFNDLQVRWSAPWNATISIGANNVFNRQGPIFYTASSNTLGNSGFVGNPSYDIGRFWYVRYNQKF